MADDLTWLSLCQVLSSNDYAKFCQMWLKLKQGTKTILSVDFDRFFTKKVTMEWFLNNGSSMFLSATWLTDKRRQVVLFNDIHLQSKSLTNATYVKKYLLSCMKRLPKRPNHLMRLGYNYSPPGDITGKQEAKKLSSPWHHPFILSGFN